MTGNKRTSGMDSGIGDRIAVRTESLEGNSRAMMTILPGGPKAPPGITTPLLKEVGS